MKAFLFEFDRQYFFSILLAFAFALPFNTLTAINSILMAMLFLLWIFKIYNSKGTILFRTPLDIPLLGLFAWAGLSMLWTADFYESFNSWIALGKQVFLFYLIATTVNAKDQFVKILFAFLSAVFIMDLFTIYYFFERGGSLFDRHVRAGSFNTLDFNLLTALMIIFLPLGFIYGIHCLSKKMKLLLYLFSFISLFALYIGFTRAGWITIVLQFLLFYYYRSRRFFYFLLGGATCLLFIFIFFAQQYNLHSNFQQKFEHPEDTTNPLTFEMRLDVWKFGFGEILKHPILGNGYGREIFQKVYKDYQIIQFTPHLHNILLETAFEIGIPGLLLFVTCFVFIFNRGFILFKTSDDYFIQLYSFFMILMLTGVLVKNLFDHIFIGNIAEIFWFLTALLFCQQSSVLKQNQPSLTARAS